MNVGNSVRKAIDDWESGEPDAAMLHACNAVDGTAKKVYPKLGSNARFIQLLRENYGILGPMRMPGINLVETRFPVKVERPKGPGGKPDLADVIYGIHRCSHGHGDEPLNLVAGLFGMNVGGIPLAQHPYGFFLVVGPLLVLTAVLAYFGLGRHRN